MSDPSWVPERNWLSRLIWPLALCLLLQAGCGGGGRSDGDSAPAPIVTPPAAPAMPFGLTGRASVAPLNLPLSGGSLGTYAVDRVFPALSFPSALFLAAVPGTNRLAVVQQSGFVRAFDNNPAAATTSLVLDLSGRITSGGEEGLLGLAFDPDFVQNRFLYVHYSAPASVCSDPAATRCSVIARFTWDPGTDRAALLSEKILLEITQPFSNHNGGMLAFGPDDHLYIAMGDGGSGGDPQNNAQTPSNLLGSMLRIDPHPVNPADAYDIPLDNPFRGRAGFRPETYALGLRNPFRFSFDRVTGDLWLGDVGQGEIEEIDLIVAGANYGWRVFEGSRPFNDSANTLPVSAFTAPVVEYDHTQGFAVIGGLVYRGGRVPSLQGRYLYADNALGTVWALDYDRVAGMVRSNNVISNVSAPAAFGEDHAGEVYVVSLNGGLFEFVETAGGSGSEPPATLSATGVFASLASLEPAAGFVEYEINQPFWSDATQKTRWVAVPDGERIDFSATNAFELPIGSVIVKHFELALIEGDPGSVRRLETRLLLHSTSGWRGFTYRWNTQGTEAHLLNARVQETITVQVAGGGSRDQLYEYPSPTDCLGCHTAAAGFTLGLEARQLNRDFNYEAVSDNQLRSWNHIGLFDRDIGASSQYARFPSADDTTISIDARARSYLHVNCAQCHRPGGPAPVALDLRIDTPLAGTGTLNVPPQAGGLGIANPRIIAPGNRAASLLWERMRRLDGQRMPPLGSHLVDAEGLDLIGAWIDGL